MRLFDLEETDLELNQKNQDKFAYIRGKKSRCLPDLGGGLREGSSLLIWEMDGIKQE